YVVGYISISKGKKNNSLALVASGEHLKTDTYSTIGIVAGLILIYFTKIYWLDSVLALIFAIVIMVTGYKIMRKSIAGIMDEADSDLLKKLVNILNLNRQNNWIDLHNLRVIKYGGQLHIDCHLTVPWYINIRDAHVEVEQLGILIKRNFGDAVEFFVHSDGCLFTQCNICNKHNCPVRQKPFEQRIEWTTDNLLTDRKHSLEQDTPLQVH
ncbi:MAG: cation diffusion facilitator family transporter, partial [Flavitalea sp.]